MTWAAPLPLGTQVAWLFILAIPVACVSWTVTHEEVLREPREHCERVSQTAPRWYVRKFFYLFICEYCFSHYVSALAVGLAGFTLLVPGWRGFLLAWFAVVWIANQYMSVFNRLRLGIKEERVTIQAKEEQLDQGPD
jgi:hypothetical protein